MSRDDYVGRFAPSPTGALHFGSLVAAAGSFWDARAHGGRWLVRIEDVDTPRTIPGAGDNILNTLANFGLEWDGDVVWQSERLQAYRQALEDLMARGLAYPCACSRKDLELAPRARDGARIYSGRCRNGLPPGAQPRAWRLRVSPGRFAVVDEVQGGIDEEVQVEVGDFVLLRADGCFAYQLAVVVDDAAAGVTHVVRGADLLDSTARQVALQEALGLPRLEYAHLPIVLNGRGEKLSKQTRAPAVNGQRPGVILTQVLSFLGQHPPPELADARLTEVHEWALSHWNLQRVPRRNGLSRPPSGQIC
ncbi:MAG: tRNA glutamyl-Q(34) synthetase GluQRS [Zoogloeaceae bacterium]|nr:tRNA glutamyl-Q(34) synthetase GluQRS [Zoogloeaceae bacterium]